jgi:hypothetical protein
MDTVSNISLSFHHFLLTLTLSLTLICCSFIDYAKILKEAK